MKKVVAGLIPLFLAISAVSGWAAGAGPGSADQQGDQIMTQYLYIHSRLADNSLDGIEKAARRIARLSGQIKNADPQLQDLLKTLETAAASFEAGELEQARQAFFELSKPLLVYLRSHYQGTEPYRAYYCSMAKKGWIQSQEDVANPYYGQGPMLGCGELIPQ